MDIRKQEPSLLVANCLADIPQQTILHSIIRKPIQYQRHLHQQVGTFLPLVNYT